MLFLEFLQIFCTKGSWRYGSDKQSVTDTRTDGYTNRRYVSGIGQIGPKKLVKNRRCGYTQFCRRNGSYGYSLSITNKVQNMQIR